MHIQSAFEKAGIRVHDNNTKSEVGLLACFGVGGKWNSQWYAGSVLSEGDTP
jgi:hypothetical protein